VQTGPRSRGNSVRSQRTSTELQPPAKRLRISRFDAYCSTPSVDVKLCESIRLPAIVSGTRDLVGPKATHIELAATLASCSSVSRSVNGESGSVVKLEGGCVHRAKLVWVELRSTRTAW
jgi:hypothetical protein